MSESFDNLAKIFAERSAQSARNKIRALKADKEGHPQKARLFRALANGQHIHAAKALMLLRGQIGTTDKNTADALNEVDTSSTALKGMIKTAAVDRNGPAESSFSHFMKSAYSHSATLKKESGEDTVYHVCQICGFISTDGVPERCPICRAVPQQFDTIE